MNDGILWVMLVLALIVVWSRYRTILTGMLFTPNYFGNFSDTVIGTTAQTGGPTIPANGLPIVPGVNANPSRGTGL